MNYLDYYKTYSSITDMPANTQNELISNFIKDFISINSIENTKLIASFFIFGILTALAVSLFLANQIEVKNTIKSKTIIFIGTIALVLSIFMFRFVTQKSTLEYKAEFFKNVNSIESFSTSLENYLKTEYKPTETEKNEDYYIHRPFLPNLIKPNTHKIMLPTVDMLDEALKYYCETGIASLDKFVTYID